MDVRDQDERDRLMEKLEQDFGSGINSNLVFFIHSINSGLYKFCRVKHDLPRVEALDATAEYFVQGLTDIMDTYGINMQNPSIDDLVYDYGQLVDSSIHQKFPWAGFFAQTWDSNNLLMGIVAQPPLSLTAKDYDLALDEGYIIYPADFEVSLGDHYDAHLPAMHRRVNLFLMVPV